VCVHTTSSEVECEMVKVVVVLGTTGYASLGLREADRKQQSVLGQERAESVSTVERC